MLWIILIYLNICLIASFIYEGFYWKALRWHDDRSVRECILPCLAIWRITENELNIVGRVLLCVIGQIFLMLSTLAFVLMLIMMLLYAMGSGLYIAIFKKKTHKKED